MLFRNHLAVDQAARLEHFAYRPRYSFVSRLCPPSSIAETELSDAGSRSVGQGMRPRAAPIDFRFDSPRQSDRRYARTARTRAQRNSATRRIPARATSQAHDEEATGTNESRVTDYLA